MFKTGPKASINQPKRGQVLKTNQFGFFLIVRENKKTGPGTFPGRICIMHDYWAFQSWMFGFTFFSSKGIGK